MSCTAEKDGRRESNGQNLAGRAGFEFFTEERQNHSLHPSGGKDTFLFDAQPAPAVFMPVVLAAGSSGILLHEAIGHGMEADFNRKNISVYSEKLNKAIAPRDVTIVDDGTKPSCRGAINVDDEGVDGQRTVLVENGILRTYMHDRIGAQHCGVEPTGNGRRQSFRSPPLPRMRNTYMMRGHGRPKRSSLPSRGGLRRNLYQRQGHDWCGRFHFLHQDRISHRRRQTHPAHQGHQHYRQRTRGARKDGHGGQ